ncbi:MAG TPA: hypothetical protein VKT83_07290 [bacterium]|nr:hypothetical protein [bacterium]
MLQSALPITLRKPDPKIPCSRSTQRDHEHAARCPSVREGIEPDEPTSHYKGDETQPEADLIQSHYLRLAAQAKIALMKTIPSVSAIYSTGNLTARASAMDSRQSSAPGVRTKDRPLDQFDDEFMGQASRPAGPFFAMLNDMSREPKGIERLQ